MNRNQRRAHSKAKSRPQTTALIGAQLAIADALNYHRAGDLAAARRLYRAMLAADPRQADALHLLGVLTQQEGFDLAAVQWIERAIRTSPAAAPYWGNLGNTLTRLARFSEAACAYNKAIAILPSYADAYYNLGYSLTKAERPALAALAFRTLIRLGPDHAPAYRDLGVALHAQGRHTDSSAAYRASICLRPDIADAYSNLGIVMKAQRQLTQAIASYRQAICIEPDFAAAHYNRGTSLKERGEMTLSLAAYQTAIALRPDYAEAYANRGVVLFDLGELIEAASSYETALRLDADMPEAGSNFLLSLHYRENVGEEEILTIAQRYARGVEVSRTPRLHTKRADTERRLRIGYVSGDFRVHPVGHFLSPILANHDRRKVEIVCYSNNAATDDMTERLRGKADHWRSLVTLSDDAAAALIATDAIDILVDLSGHTAHNRLPLFALKPAPVQVSWLGFWGTTGLSAMDYILSDATTILPTREANYTERIFRLPGCRFCYAPPDYAPEPTARRGGITFGSFNNLSKVGPNVIRLWAALLAAVPHSRLVLKWRSLANERVRQRLRDAFLAQGIGAERLDLRTVSPHPEMLAAYGDIDVALDPFPFSGGLTSCEALWMGVPVVTLPGAGAQSRQTLGFLESLGLSEWAASSPEDYIRIAAGLATDGKRLDLLRRDLRERMARSPLCDGSTFTGNLEGAYREMWRNWCLEQDPSRN